VLREFLGSFGTQDNDNKPARYSSIQKEYVHLVDGAVSKRGVELFYKAEYCGTPQLKEMKNRGYKVSLNNRALRLLDRVLSAGLKKIRIF
jgi:predicted metalloprotease